LPLIQFAVALLDRRFALLELVVTLVPGGAVIVERGQPLL
jgi:hypothetical protein